MAEDTKGFRVNDRRRFDEQGNERDSVLGGSSDAGVVSNVPPERAQPTQAQERDGVGGSRVIRDRGGDSQFVREQFSVGDRDETAASRVGAAAAPATKTSNTGTPNRAEESVEHNTAPRPGTGSGAAGPSGPSGHPGHEHFGVSFSAFLMSLATQALMQMGELEPPGGGLKLPPDFEAAKQTIEIIGMLASKTKGNLDSEEQRLVTEILHTLRLTFVQRLKAAGAAPQPR